MIELRTYDGDGSEIVELMGRAWRHRYDGRMWFPLWDVPFFRWQLLAERPGGRDLLVGAYEGGRLVGCCFAERFDYRLGDQVMPASIGSWLTVDPETKFKGLGTQIIEDLRRRHLEQDLRFMLGYCLGDSSASANRFWHSYAQKRKGNLIFLRRMGYWVHLIDPRLVAANSLSSYERLQARAAGLLGRRSAATDGSSGVRPYRPADLAACFDATQNMLEHADLAMLWTRKRLSLQLDYEGFPQTLVLEDEGRVKGFVNYHQWWLVGKAAIRTAIIDLFVCDALSHRQRKDLLGAAVRRMEEDGYHTALALRTGMMSSRTMLSCGFLPRPASDYLMLVYPGPDFKIAAPRRIHVLFR